MECALTKSFVLEGYHIALLGEFSQSKVGYELNKSIPCCVLHSQSKAENSSLLSTAGFIYYSSNSLSFKI